MKNGVSKDHVLVEGPTDRKRDFLKIAVVVVFWGALWGLIEATIGYGLHLLNIKGVTGFFLFPMACYYMDQVRRQTKNLIAIIYMAILAAFIKLLDFFIPGHDPIKIIYPAISIILEGLAVFGTFKIAERFDRKFRYSEALFASASWRIVFTLFQLVTLAQDKFPSPGRLVKFMLLDSIINSLLIYLYIRFLKPDENEGRTFIKHISPVASIIVFVLAIFSKWVM